jgi:hypothetical protein
MAIIGVDGMPLVNKCTNSHHWENCERAQCSVHHDPFEWKCVFSKLVIEYNVNRFKQ